jgi:hypothetical protein
MSDKKLDLILDKLEKQDQKLQEHSLHLIALREGMEKLDADLDGFKHETRENFNDLKHDMQVMQHQVDWVTERTITESKKRKVK